MRDRLTFVLRNEVNVTRKRHAVNPVASRLQTDALARATHDVLSRAESRGFVHFAEADVSVEFGCSVDPGSGMSCCQWETIS